MRDFSKDTIRKLAKNGIAILRPVAIPTDSLMPYANADRGYSVNDNGTGRIWSFQEVISASVK